MAATCDDLRLGGTQHRFWLKVDASGDCWNWIPEPNRAYGRFKLSGQEYPAHRFAWTLLVGDIPDGYQVDHLCKNTRCVNPDHLEPVTPRTNLMRSASWAAKQAAQTHCKRGHPLLGENMARYGKTGYRFCLTCHRRRSRDSQRRRRGRSV